MRRERKVTIFDLKHAKQGWGVEKAITEGKPVSWASSTGKSSVLGVGSRTASLENIWQGGWSYWHLSHETRDAKISLTNTCLSHILSGEAN